MDLKKINITQFLPEIKMYSKEQIGDLEELFTIVESAHQSAFKETEGFDPEWPLWYAKFLHEKIMDVLNLEFTKSELIYLLVAADMDHKDEEPESSWSVYYANFIAESLS